MNSRESVHLQNPDVALNQNWIRNWTVFSSCANIWQKPVSPFFTFYSTSTSSLMQIICIIWNISITVLSYSVIVIIMTVEYATVSVSLKQARKLNKSQIDTSSVCLCVYVMWPPEAQKRNKHHSWPMCSSVREPVERPLAALSPSVSHPLFLVLLVLLWKLHHIWTGPQIRLIVTRCN